MFISIINLRYIIYVIFFLKNISEVLDMLPMNDTVKVYLEMT